MCIEFMNITLAEAGACSTDVISTRATVAASRQKDLVSVQKVVREAFGPHEGPPAPYWVPRVLGRGHQ